MHLGIHGVTGRMGQSLLQELKSFLYFDTIVGFVNHAEHGQNLSYIPYSDRLEFLKNSDVIIDFSSPLGVKELLAAAKKHPTPLVLGTTGLTEDLLMQAEEISKKKPVLISSNFSLGVFACLEAATILSQILKNDFTIKIRETHHKHKKDAPSGTALSLAKASGASKIDSIRQGELIGIHEVFFESPYEKISLKHDSFSRQIYAQGALKCAQALSTKKSGLYSLKDLFPLTSSL